MWALSVVQSPEGNEISAPFHVNLMYKTNLDPLPDAAREHESVAYVCGARII